MRLACVFAHTVQPCEAVFTVRLDATDEAAAAAANSAPLSWHALLLMSGGGGGRLLATGEEIKEVTR